MGILGALLVAGFVCFVVGLAALCVYYEVRRARRIRLGIPLEDVKVEPRGFDVVMTKPDASAEPQSPTVAGPTAR